LTAATPAGIGHPAISSCLWRPASGLAHATQSLSGALYQHLLITGCGDRRERSRRSCRRRFRDKADLAFVGSQSCLVCGRHPVDPHHIRFAQKQSLGRKVSDEFTVPLCRSHHRALHRSGSEYLWWENVGIDPFKVARKLWKQTRPKRSRGAADRQHGQPDSGSRVEATDASAIMSAPPLGEAAASAPNRGHERP
jgi:hypothetical protein